MSNLNENGLAVTDCTITVFNYTPSGEYAGASSVFLAKGVGIPALSTLVSPPAAKTGYVAVFSTQTNSWSYVEDHRGTTVWVIGTGQQTTITDIGPIDTTKYTTVDPSTVTVVPTLTSRLADLETLCQEHMTAGIYFTPSGYTNPSLFDTGVASQSKMLTSFVAASNGLWPASAVWKIDDGSFVNMTATDVINLAKKSQAYIQACYATEADLQTKLQADLTTDITVGWPSNK